MPGFSSIEFFRQAHWSGLPFPPPEDLPNPGIKPTSPVSPALQMDSLPAEPMGKPPSNGIDDLICKAELEYGYQGGQGEWNEWGD